MFICSNCKHFTSKLDTCECCKKNVCHQCIVMDEDRCPRHGLSFQLCSNCVCANCVIDDKLYIGYNKCKECSLQYCDDCFLKHYVNHVKKQ